MYCITLATMAILAAAGFNFDISGPGVRPYVQVQVVILFAGRFPCLVICKYIALPPSDLILFSISNYILVGVKLELESRIYPDSSSSYGEEVGKRFLLKQMVEMPRLSLKALDIHI